jgi:exosome complex component CSL4
MTTPPAVVLPGHVFGPTDKFAPGLGTHVYNNAVVASIMGRPLIYRNVSSLSNKPRTTITLERPIPPHVRTPPLLPSVGTQILAKITRLTRVQAICEIIVVGGPTAASTAVTGAVIGGSNNNSTTPSMPTATPSRKQQPTTTTSSGKPKPQQPLLPTQSPFRGILRAQDVRATEKDKVKLADLFRVGDIIRAVVISLGDQGGYFLSTAGNEFGVLMSWSDKGNVCVPISWCEVQDTVTGEREERKVAKPI